MKIIQKFVGQLSVGDTVVLKEYQACKWHDRECKVELVEFFTSGEFECATLEFTFPCGMVKTQTWYQAETIRVVEAA